MATVYRAYQASMDRHVAIKVIRSSILQDATLRERFRREARLIARLEHPHLLPVYDFDGDHDPPYIVMRYLEGGTLKQILAQGELPQAEILYTLRQVASALDYAHRQGVVHRDLKPSNIMIDKEGNAFVTDFGIARAAENPEQLTDAGNVIGTPSYMAPEQARGASDLDGAADRYALGVIVFELLTGALPFHGEGSLAVLMAQLHEEAPAASSIRPTLPSAVDDVLKKALAKDRAARFPSSEAFVSALADALRVKSANAPAHLQSLTQTLSLAQLRELESKSRKSKRETPSAATPTEQQRQMTAVYVDVAELASALYSAGKDAEAVRARMDALWRRFDEIAREEGGVIQTRADDVGVALWGRTRVAEDDPERAVRAVLRMREAATEEAKGLFGAAWEPSDDNPLPFVAGVTSGAVLLERSAETGTYTASGSTITLASRIKEAAAPGTILMAHDTYSQVLGVFGVSPHDALRIRGRKDALEVVEVTGVKPRAFRAKARGIEGVETKMIGREIELRLLEEALTLTMEDGETQVVTVVGEAGVGKSRLLFEFSNWTELVEQTFWLFEARATEPSMIQPYSLTRDLFSMRFQILDSDSLDVVHQKFVGGVAEFLGEGSQEQAELMGQLVGFDFSARPAVAEALKDGERFRQKALGLLGDFFTAASRIYPVVIHIEDIHWADDRSLDLINNLVRDNAKLPLFVLCMARPSLYERRPQWGEGQHFHERVQLEPLSQLSSRRLVRELLKKMSEVPPELRDVIVDRADGNPFYIEELIKALIDDGVIVKGAEVWTVDRSRLSELRVPPTLTGVLQSRLDALPLPLQQMLQRTSVVGRVFWDAAAEALSQDAGLDGEDVRDLLDDLRKREMILRREESSFAGTIEYVFRHAILREVTYQTLVPRQRRSLHKLAGEWLLHTGGERAGELTLLVAEHFAKADEAALAAEQFRKAGRVLIPTAYYEEAVALLERARALVLADEHQAVRLEIELSLGEVLALKGDFDRAHAVLESAIATARATKNRSALVRGLGQIGRVGMWRDDHRAKDYFEEALPLARELGDEPNLIFMLRQMGNMLQAQPERAEPYLKESLELARRIGDPGAEAAATNSLGNVYMLTDPKRALAHYEQSLALARKHNARSSMIPPWANIVLMNIELKDFERAARELEDVAQFAKSIGEQFSLMNMRELRAQLELRRGGSLETVKSHLREALAGYFELGVRPVWTMTTLALLATREGDRVRGLELSGLAHTMETSQRAAVDFELRTYDPEIQAGFTPDEIAAAFERGRAIDPDRVLHEFLEGSGAAAGVPAERPEPEAV
jgi:class 3 adenylate cyclase/tRNA A-37 threonylcarbamoyl transferase component Bud32/tetratricopeptide (TPR) repeat protein